MQVTKNIDGHEVCWWRGNTSGEIIITIDDKTSKSEKLSKATRLKVLRFCFEVWEQEKTTGLTFYCYPDGSIGNKEGWRTKFYKKHGFTSTGEGNELVYKPSII